MNVDLERLLGWIALMTLATLLAIGAFAFTQDHTVQYYYLGESESVLQVRADIDWGPDSYVDLDRSVTYEEAVALINKLNRDLNLKVR